MNLTYEIINNGYLIKNNGRNWIKQDAFIPYPGTTIEESAQNHINAILLENNSQPTPPSVDAQIQELMMAVAELGATVSANTVETQLALAELANLLLGGND